MSGKLLYKHVDIIFSLFWGQSVDFKVVAQIIHGDKIVLTTGCENVCADSFPGSTWNWMWSQWLFFWLHLMILADMALCDTSFVMSAAMPR